MADRHHTQPLPTSGHPMAAGVQNRRQVFSRRLSRATVILLLGLDLALDSLYHMSTTAQAFSFHLAIVHPGGWLMIIVNVLAAVGASLLLLGRRAKQRK
jgi:hypothetical protein